MIYKTKQEAEEALKKEPKAYLEITYPNLVVRTKSVEAFVWEINSFKGSGFNTYEVRSATFCLGTATDRSIYHDGKISYNLESALFWEIKEER